MQESGTTTESSFLEPDQIIRSFDLKSGDHIADFGVGHGYFTIPMARSVGGDGKVYAIDIQKAALDIVRARARLEHLLNIEYVRADLDQPNGSRLKDRFIDFVLIANALFQATQKSGLIHEAYRVLREGGRMVIIEWRGENPAGSGTVGPRPDARVKKEDARWEALQAGFELDREFAAGSHHYGLLFVKK